MELRTTKLTFFVTVPAYYAYHFLLSFPNLIGYTKEGETHSKLDTLQTHFHFSSRQREKEKGKEKEGENRRQECFVFIVPVREFLIRSLKFSPFLLSSLKSPIIYYINLQFATLATLDSIFSSHCSLNVL